MKKLLFCLLALILIAGACGESAREEAIEKKIEAATGADAEVDISKKQVKVTGETEEGEYALTSGEDVEIPEDFPSDVFIYRPSTTVMAMKVPEGHSVTLTTGDDKSKVVQACKREMEASGWTEEGSMVMGDKTMLMYKKDGRVAGINMGPSDKGLHIVVTTGKE